MINQVKCPRCGQGAIMTMRVTRTGESIQVCDECEAVWPIGIPPSVPGFEDLSVYLEKREIDPLWSSLEYI